MEFIILRDTEVTFSGPARSSVAGGLRGRTSTSPLEAKIEATKNDANGTDNRHYSEQLVTAIIKNPWARRFSSEETKVDWSLDVAIHLPAPAQFVVDAAGVTTDTEAGGGERKMVEMWVYTKKYSDKHFISILRDGFNDRSLMVNVAVKNFGLSENSSSCASGFNWKINGLMLKPVFRGNGFTLKFNKESVGRLESDILSAWSIGREFCGTFTISLTLSNGALSWLDAKKLDPLNERFEHLEDMLQNEICTDFEILAGVNPHQKVVKCHRAFLAAGSGTFRRMFENGMKEVTVKKIEIKEMSVRGVRAMLAFMYYRDITAAYASSEIALELLEAGEKYEIGGLTDTVRKYMMAKENQWFGVDMVLKLYDFVRVLCPNKGKEIEDVEDEDTEMESDEDGDVSKEMDPWKPLKIKCLKVLKWYNKMKPNTLLESVKYQGIFSRNPKLGIEITAGMLRLK